MMYSGDSGVGEVANFDCNTGYMLEGPDNVTCGADYQWSTSPPTCTLSKSSNMVVILDIIPHC